MDVLGPRRVGCEGEVGHRRGGELLQPCAQASRHLPELAGEEVADVAEALGDVSELDGRYDTAP